ncbi:ras homolog gene family, member D (predicted), isoform CRA_c [Rattus norvegicus]|uniref:Ras homolog gene family, member D (Predicted), isoform CRA_c n=1 Tax=Rattus norvegicus TaxID=10116 RepID=A6HYX2_RAT|nr:ras homolog gene family, member D (predicted), isoform CRA_c [Rattus norvegicus]
MNASQTEGEEAPHSGRPIKVVLVGDGGCGKTSLMMVFANGAFPESYNPTCSARLHDNVEAVFQEAAEVALSSRSHNFWRRITQNFCVVT